MENVIVIGIAGGTGSGKSTLIQRIKEEFADKITMLSHDFYYKAHDEMTYEERCKLNYDHPHAIETELMIEHVKALKEWKAIERPVYDFTIHNRKPNETVTVMPSKVVIVEGILIFAMENLRNLMDFRIFVDTDADIRLCRRIKRDVNKRARSLDSVLTQYQATVKPMHDKYVEPSKKFAHLVVPEGGKNQIALEMIASGIRQRLDNTAAAERE